MNIAVYKSFHGEVLMEIEDKNLHSLKLNEGDAVIINDERHIVKNKELEFQNNKLTTIIINMDGFFREPPLNRH